MDNSFDGLKQCGTRCLDSMLGAKAVGRNEASSFPDLESTKLTRQWKQNVFQCAPCNRNTSGPATPFRALLGRQGFSQLLLD